MNGASGINEAQFVRRVLIIIGLVALALLAWALRYILMMVFGAVVVATLFRALADLLQRWARLPPNVALVAAILLIAGIVGGAIVLFGQQIATQAQGLMETIPAAWRSLQERLAGFGIAVQTYQLPSGSQSGGMAASLGRFVMSLGGGLFDTLLIVVGGIFLASQPRFYLTGLIKLVPEVRRGLVAEASKESGQALKLWLKAQLLIMLIIGVLTGLGLWLLGVPSALALGILAALLEFIPFVGPILAAVPAVLVALAIDPQLALWTVGLYVVIQQTEGNVISPLMQQWAVELPGAILIFALIAFGTLFGAIGIIFAAPLTVVCYVLIKRLYVRETLNTATPIPGEDKA